MTKDNELTTTTPGSGAVIVAPDYGADARLGFDQMTKDDKSLPFIKLLQALSPEVSDPEKKIKGAEAGQLLNSVTREVSTEIFFVPVDRDHSFIEWVPRAAGGGFVGRHEPNSPVIAAAKAKNNGSAVGLKSDKGNELKETFVLYGLVLPSATAESCEGRYAVIAFDSTKIKEYRDAMYRLDSAKTRAPLFANRVRIGSRGQKNAKGSSYNFAITPAIEGDPLASLIDPKSQLFKEGKEFFTLVRGGTAKADFSKTESEPESTEDDGKHF